MEQQRTAPDPRQPRPPAGDRDTTPERPSDAEITPLDEEKHVEDGIDVNET